MKYCKASVRKNANELVLKTGDECFILPYPPLNSDNYDHSKYVEIAEKMLKSGLSLPSGDLTAQLVYVSHCNHSVKEKAGFKQVRDIMQRNGLWVYQVNIWTHDGVYVVHDALGKGRTDIPIEELERKLKSGRNFGEVRFSQDSYVRFAPRHSYSYGLVTPEHLARDGFVIASLNPDGAEKWAKVAAQTGREPILHTLFPQEGSTPVQRVTVISEDFGRLALSGDIVQFPSDRRFAYGIKRHG